MSSPNPFCQNIRKSFVKQSPLIPMRSMLITRSLGMTRALSLALPCALFRFSNGFVAANTTVNEISALSHHIGTGFGIVGAWQMPLNKDTGTVSIKPGSGLDLPQLE